MNIGLSKEFQQAEPSPRWSPRRKAEAVIVLQTTMQPVGRGFEITFANHHDARLFGMSTAERYRREADRIRRIHRRFVHVNKICGGYDNGGGDHFPAVTLMGYAKLSATLLFVEHIIRYRTY